MKENESDNDIETDNDDIVIVKRIKMILAPETNITKMTVTMIKIVMTRTRTTKKVHNENDSENDKGHECE